MLPPDYLARIMEGAEEVASMLHTDILNDVVKRIMIRLDRGDSYVLTATDKWQLETLMESGYLREDIEKEIARRTGLQRNVIRKAFEDAGVRSLRYDDAVYRSAGISTVPLSQSPALIRTLQTMYERTMGEWDNITRTTANEAQRLFIQVCDKAYTQVMSGAKSRSQAVKEAVETVSKDGVKVLYPTGHEDTIETATARAVRTGIAQGAAQITLERMQEMGVDLVLTSSHLGARPTHEPWQGKVFHVDFSVLTGRLRSANAETRSGATHEYPDLVEATRYGYVDGLCGANCRHSMMPYIEGVTKNPFEQFDSEENLKRYKLEQEQREMERKIRKVKREVQGLQTAIDNADELTKPELEAQHQKRAQRLTELNKEYKAFCEANELKTRQERLSIAGWTKKEASRASGAARKSIANSGKRDIMAQEGYGSGVPLEYQGNFDDFEPITISSAERTRLIELRSLAAKGGVEYGAVKSRSGFSDSYTSNAHDHVEVDWDLYSDQNISLYHSHTNSTVLSAGDMRLLLTDKAKVDKVFAVTRDGDVFAVSINGGDIPTIEDFDDFVSVLRDKVDLDIMEWPNFYNWTPAERLYVAVREQAYRISLHYHWRLEGGAL